MALRGRPRAPTVPEAPGTPPDPILELEDVMRDALSDLLQAESLYAPVVDGERRIAGVLSIEIISEFLNSPDALSDEHPAAERPLARRLVIAAVAAALLPSAQNGEASSGGRAATPPSVWPRTTPSASAGRSTTSTATSPPLQHVALVLPSVVLGFLVAFALALVSHRRRWLIPAVTGATGILYTLPSIALFPLLCRSPVAAR